MFKYCFIIAVAICLTSCATARYNSAPPTTLSHGDQIEANELANRIVKLSPTISPDEAQELSETTYLTARRLAIEYQMVWPSGVQNMLIATGKRKRGYCFHWAEDIMTALDKLKLQTIELHWAEAFIGTSGEHNVPVVTAIGQPYMQGIMLDGWRYAGKLHTAYVAADMRYFEWRENKAQRAKVFAKGRAATPPASTPASSPVLAPASAPSSPPVAAPDSTTR